MSAGRPGVPAGPASGWIDAAASDGRALRDLFGSFLTGVTIVTVRDPAGVPRGFTANSFTSVSLDPPLVLVCVGRTAGSYEALCGAARFGVNILADTQREASNAFASRRGTKFEAVETWSVAGGPPLIEGCLGALDCARVQVVEAGDHAIVIGQVLGFRALAGQPLGFFRGGYTALAADLAALERQGDAILIGALLEDRASVLLVRHAGQERWDFPLIPLRHGEDHRQALPRLFADLGITAEVSALYSVFQEPGEPHTLMLFRGEAGGPAASESLADGTRLRFFAERDEPWTSMAGPAHAAVLRRFYRERAASRFGIYWDTVEGGQIAALEGRPHPWTRSKPTGGA